MAFRVTHISSEDHFLTHIHANRIPRFSFISNPCHDCCIQKGCEIYVTVISKEQATLVRIISWLLWENLRCHISIDTANYAPLLLLLTTADIPRSNFFLHKLIGLMQINYNLMTMRASSMVSHLFSLPTIFSYTQVMWGTVTLWKSTFGEVWLQVNFSFLHSWAQCYCWTSQTFFGRSGKIIDHLGQSLIYCDEACHFCLQHKSTIYNWQ